MITKINETMHKYADLKHFLHYLLAPVKQCPIVKWFCSSHIHKNSYLR